MNFTLLFSLCAHSVKENFKSTHFHRDSGSEYLHAFAKFLKAEYMNKSVQDIFRMVEAAMMVSSTVHYVSLRCKISFSY